MSYKHTIPLFCCFFLLILQLSAQDSSSKVLLSARPGNSPFPSRLSAGTLVFETGIARGREKLELSTDKTMFMPFQLRYGILKNMEINITLPYQSLRQNGASTANGLGATKIGAKFRITEERGIYPQIEFQGNLNLPYFGEENFIPEDVEPSFNFSFLNNRSESFQLSYGFGMFWRGPDENGFYGIKATKFITKSSALFAEHYSFLRGNGKNEVHIATGYILLLNNKLQLDTSLDLGKMKGKTLYIFNLGVSILLKKEP